jgi:hypothetical protein
MSFRFHTFNRNKFSATNFLSKIKDKYDVQELNLNTIRSIQLTNDIEDNKKIKNNILEKNLEEELTKKNNNENDENNNTQLNSKSMKEILLKMLKYNSYLPNEAKSDIYNRSKDDISFSNIISCFQLIMKYLYELEENIKNKNNFSEKNISILKNAEKAMNEIIPKNNEKINNLEQKKLKLQTFLKINGKEVKTKKNNKLYICDACPYPYKKFYGYRDFHKHYVKRHINPYLCLNDYGIVNQGFDKYYFDNKMNELTEDVTDMFKKAKSQKKVRVDNDFNEIKNNINFLMRDRKIEGIRRNRRYETVGPNTNNSIILKNSKEFSNSYNEKRNEFIRKRIELIKDNQRQFENNFQNQIDSFLRDFKNEIIKIKQNQMNLK